MEDCSLFKQMSDGPPMAYNFDRQFGQWSNELPLVREFKPSI